MNVADFLLARIAEDELAATTTGGQAWSADVPGMVHADPRGRAKSRYVASVEHEVERQHIVRWNPARVLAECEAKRRIVELHSVCDWDNSHGPCDTLRLLALPYADYPDYRQEWAP